MEPSSEAVGTQGISNEKSNANGHVSDVTSPTAEVELPGENPQLKPIVSEGKDETVDDQHENTNPIGVGVAPPKKRSKKKSKSKRGLVIFNPVRH